MIGTNLNLSLPLLSDSLSTIVAKTATALSAIEDSIADRATPAALNIASALSFGGNWATNLGGAVLVAGNHPTAAGSFYYDSGEFFLVDSTGIVQVTLNGQLDASSFGGIGGDYGGSNPALVYYDTASGEYRFYTDGGTHAWGDVVARALVLEGASGTVKLNVDASVVTNKTYALGNLVSGEALVYDGTKIAGATAVTSDWTAVDFHHTGNYTYDLPVANAVYMAANPGILSGDDDFISAVSDNKMWRSVPLSMIGLRVGDTITGLHGIIVKSTAAAADWRLRKKNGNSAASTIASFDSASWSTGAPTSGTWAPFTQYTIVQDDRVWFELDLAKAGDGPVNIRISVTHP